MNTCWFFFCHVTKGEWGKFKCHFTFFSESKMKTLYSIISNHYVLSSHFNDRTIEVTGGTKAVHTTCSNIYGFSHYNLHLR